MVRQMPAVSAGGNALCGHWNVQYSGGINVHISIAGARACTARAQN